MPPPLALPKLILQELTPNTCPCFLPGCGFTSLGTAEMRTSTSNPEAQQQRGCPCRGQGSVIPADPMGQENSAWTGPGAPHREGNASPQWGQSQSPTKILLLRGCRSRNLTHSKQGQCLFQEISWGKLSPAAPSIPKEQWLLPQCQQQSFSLPSWNKGPTFTSLTSSRSRTSSSWSSRLFLRDEGFHSSVSSTAPGALPSPQAGGEAGK